jgi:glycosyltransferase involved in cell wall biosynthesis
MSAFLSAELSRRRARNATTFDLSAYVTAAPGSTRSRGGLRRDAQISTNNLLALAFLFQEEYYLAANSDVAETKVSPLEHFLAAGSHEGRQPNPYFHPLWYLEQNPDIGEAGIHPLVHYVLIGDPGGRSPSRWFDTRWYRTHYQVRDSELALLHYLQRRETNEYSPIPDFDVRYYCSHNPDVTASGVDPFEHFMNTGWREWRNPSPDIDLKFYAKRYLTGAVTENPLFHYLRYKNQPGIYGRAPDHEVELFHAVKRFSQPGPDFEPFRPLPAAVPRKAKLLAYYLPQFHAIPENDAWWGTGFTEWTNVARGLPRFTGHYQPRIPRDLGFYCLDSDEALVNQVKLARAAGIYGMVFYYYNFNGKRLLDKPIERFLAMPALDCNFALMWTNENWTRRWDGHDSEILIAQEYCPADEELLLADFARHFADPRYIRLGQRPLLMVYRPGLIPDAAEAFTRWRRFFADRFGEHPIIIMAQGFGDLDPRPFDLDGAIEFPPHKLTEGLSGIEDELKLLDPEFTGRVHRYDDVVKASLEQPHPAYPVIRTLVPGWDNDARRQGSGMVIAGSTPAKYEAWLSRLVSDTTWPMFFGERIVCVNAWNEWAEAAYLEPDQHYGAAYLNATARAVAGLNGASRCRLLLVGHDAHRHGAQELLLNIGRTLRDSFGVEIEYLLLNSGILLPRYEAIAKTTVVSAQQALPACLDAVRARGFASAIVNTTASAHIVKPAVDRAIECTVLVHELPRLIHEKNLTTGTRMALRHARRVVFPATFCRDEVLRAMEAPLTNNLTVCPQGSYKLVDYSAADAQRVRRELGVGESEKLVLGVGFGDLRKGFDLFIQTWRILREQHPGIQFAWVGRLDPQLAAWLESEIADATETGTFHVVDFTEQIGAYYSAADAFVLTSREDPYPTVVLEALGAGVPVAAFDRTGGIPEMLSTHDMGLVVPYCDVTSMAAALWQLLAVDRITDAERAARRRLIDTDYAWQGYVRRLLDFAIPNLGKISVAVPNYNYSHYLNARLTSIFGQGYPLHEVLVLDDCSTDDSLATIAAIQQSGREFRLIVNQQNSGSVAAQWLKAAQLAEGEFLWIAEADDGAEPEFVARLCALLVADPAVVFAFCDSRTVDTEGLPLGDSYKPYYSTVEPAALARNEVFDGAKFVERMLSVKNLILNVSSVVWRRDALLRALESCRAELPDFRMAHDWRIYLEALREPGAKVAYDCEPLNVHRRHGQSVTHALDGRRHVDEIARVHQIARDAFGLSETARDRQSRYIAEISAQLGVSAGTVSDFGSEDAKQVDATSAALPLFEANLGSA